MINYELTGLWLQLNKVSPHLAHRLAEVADLGVGMQTEHLGRVRERQRVDEVCSRCTMYLTFLNT